MVINQRIREIRNRLNMTQTEFGAKIGASRSIISNIEYDKVEASELIIKAICKIYSVNEEWLRTGISPMFIQNIDSLVDKIAERDGLDDDDKEIIRMIYSLEPEYRKGLINFLKRFIEVDLAKHTRYAARTETGEESAPPKIPDLSKVPDEGEEI